LFQVPKQLKNKLSPRSRTSFKLDKAESYMVYFIMATAIPY